MSVQEKKLKIKKILASETLSGVTQLKIGDVCLFIFGRMYVILYFDPLVFSS